MKQRTNKTQGAAFRFPFRSALSLPLTPSCRPSHHGTHQMTGGQETTNALDGAQDHQTKNRKDNDAKVYRRIDITRFPASARMRVVESAPGRHRRDQIEAQANGAKKPANRVAFRSSAKSTSSHDHQQPNVLQYAGRKPIHRERESANRVPQDGPLTNRLIPPIDFAPEGSDRTKPLGTVSLLLGGSRLFFSPCHL